jgi:hypothetical protein
VTKKQVIPRPKPEELAKPATKQFAMHQLLKIAEAKRAGRIPSK